MTKKELIEKLEPFNDDTEICFPHQEYGGYMQIDTVYADDVRTITDAGEKAFPETGVKYRNKKDLTGYAAFYTNYETKIIVLE